MLHMTHSKHVIVEMSLSRQSTALTSRKPSITQNTKQMQNTVRSSDEHEKQNIWLQAAGLIASTTNQKSGKKTKWVYSWS